MGTVLGVCRRRYRVRWWPMPRLEGQMKIHGFDMVDGGSGDARECFLLGARRATREDWMGGEDIRGFGW